MKISCLQDNLAKGLSIVSRAVSPRSTLPVLGNVLLAVDNGRLKLSATNLEIVITCWIGATVTETGATTVPARTFSELVNTFPPDRVDLSLNKTTETLHVSCGRTQANVKGINANEFPVIPEPDHENRIRMEPAVLKRVIAQVAFAAATDDSRPSLTGVQTTFEGNRITMAATDGFRLSVRSAHIAGYVEKPFNVIIPARALSEVGRIISDDLEAVYISMPSGRNQIIFDMDNVLLVSQLIDGKFPDFERVIPASLRHHIRINRLQLIQAMQRAAILTIEKLRGVRVILGENTLKIISANAEQEEATEEIEVDYAGESIDAGFNVGYLLDMLNNVQADEVQWSFNDAGSSSLLTVPENTQFKYVVMPMRI